MASIGQALDKEWDQMARSEAADEAARAWAEAEPALAGLSCVQDALDRRLDPWRRCDNGAWGETPPGAGPHPHCREGLRGACGGAGKVDARRGPAGPGSELRAVRVSARREGGRAAGSKVRVDQHLGLGGASRAKVGEHRG